MSQIYLFMRIALIFFSKDMPKVWPLLYKVKLELHSHRSGVITADQDGVVEIRLKLSEFTRRDANLKCELVTKQRARKIENFELACYTFQYAEGDYQVTIIQSIRRHTIYSFYLDSTREPARWAMGLCLLF